MFTALFGDLKGARLARLPYFGYTVLLTVVLTLIVAVTVAAIAGTENLANGSLEEIQRRFAATAGGPTVMVFTASMLALLFAHFNLMAKRVRDIGLPGWPVVLVIFVISAIIAGGVSEEHAGKINTLLWLALVLVPGDTFGGGGSDATDSPA